MDFIPQLEAPFALSAGDLNSSLWTRLRDHMEQRLQDLRGRNDGPLDQTETARVRGQIQAYKDILALAEFEPPLES